MSGARAIVPPGQRPRYPRATAHPNSPSTVLTEWKAAPKMTHICDERRLPELWSLCGRAMTKDHGYVDHSVECVVCEALWAGCSRGGAGTE